MRHDHLVLRYDLQGLMMFGLYLTAHVVYILSCVDYTRILAGDKWLTTSASMSIVTHNVVIVYFIECLAASIPPNEPENASFANVTREISSNLHKFSL